MSSRSLKLNRREHQPLKPHYHADRSLKLIKSHTSHSSLQFHIAVLCHRFPVQGGAVIKLVNSTMPTNRSRSASPERRSASPDARKRSRSPPRKPRGSGGFRWKSRQAAPDDEQPRRDFNDSYRPKRYDRDGGRHRDGRAPESRNMPDRNPDRRSRHTAAAGRDGSGPRSGGDRPDERSMDGVERKAKGPDKQQGASKSKSQNRSTQNPAALTGSAPATFIIVTVNDRLGTKASIPCLPSDTVGELEPVPGPTLRLTTS